MGKLRIIPCTYKFASEYVNHFHRHHNAPVDRKFCIAVSDGNDIHGVAVCGKPVSRYLDNGFNCEILRVCTDGTHNASAVHTEKQIILVIIGFFQLYSSFLLA